MKNSTTLVLVGGFGFVGRNILDTIAGDPASEGLAPAVIDDLSNAAPGHEALDLPSYAGGYETAGALAFLDSLETADQGRIFVFLAGETRVAESKDRPLDFIEANIASPARFVMEAVRPGDRFILVSTAGALFDGSFEVRLDSPYCPKNFYGATKAAEEMILQRLVELRGGSFGVIRMTNVYGAYSDNKKSAIHAFTRAAIEGRGVTVNGDGGQTRDFVFAGDVGRGIATMARRMRDGEAVPVVNMLGSGQSTSLMDVIANPEDVRVLLGETITPFEEGIRATHAYYAGRSG